MLRSKLLFYCLIVATFSSLFGSDTAFAARKLHVIVVGDVDDPKIGKHASFDTENITQLMRGSVAPADLSQVRALNGDLIRATQKDILAGINRVNTKPEDAVLFYYSGHGAYAKDDKHYLVTQSGKEWIPRQTILDALRKKGLALTVVITDCCFNFSPRPPMPVAKDARAEAETTAPLFLKLFFQTSGFIDVNSVKKGQVAGTYIDVQRGSIFTQSLRQSLIENALDNGLTWETLLAQVDTDAAKAFRELYPEGQLVETASGSFNQREQRLVKLTFDVRPVGQNSRPEPDDGGDPDRSGGPPIVDRRDTQVSNSAKIASARLGLTVQDHPGPGVRIVAVAKGGPATQCQADSGRKFSLQLTDSIVVVNGTEIADVQQFARVIGAADSSVKLGVADKNGIVRDYTARLLDLDMNRDGGGQKGGGNGGVVPPSPGKLVLDGVKKSRFGAHVIQHQQGVEVTAVNPNAPAERCVDEFGNRWKLVPGDIIRKINGRAVRDEIQFRQAIEKSPREMKLEVLGVEQGEFELTSLLEN